MSQIIRYLKRSISMETQENQWSWIGAEIPISELWRQPVKFSRCLNQSIFRWHEDRQWQSGRFSWHQFECFWWSYCSRHKGCSYISCCGDFTEIYIKFSNFSLPWEKGSFSFQWHQVKERAGEKLGILVWRFIAWYWRKWKEFNIQSSLQVEGKHLKRQMTSTRI